MMRAIQMAVACVAMLVVTEQVWAGLMIQPISVTNGLIAIPTTSNSQLKFLIDKSGLTPAYTSLTDFDTYVSSTLHGTAASQAWVTNAFTPSGGNGPPANLDFNLGGAFLVESLGLWNWDTSDNAALKDFTIWAANNSLFTGATKVGDFVATQYGLTAGKVEGEIKAFTTPVSARFIRLELKTTYGSTSQIALREVVFEGHAVPEPSSLVLFGIGACVAGFGVARRRRREKQQVVAA